MDKTFILRLIPIITISLLFLSACRQADEIRESDAEEKIRDLDNQEVQAILSKDTHILNSIWSPEFVVNSPLGGGLVEKNEVINRVLKDIISYDKYEKQIEHISRLGDEVVVVMGEETLYPTAHNPDSGTVIRRRFTDIWHHRNGSWKKTNRHAHIVR